MRSAREFRQVLRHGIRLDGALFTLVAMPNARGFSRVGLAASRRVGGAVGRNRAKRLLRETFRSSPSAGAFDLVLIPKQEILVRSQREVELEFRRRLRRLAARFGAGSGRAGAPVDD